MEYDLFIVGRGCSCLVEYKRRVEQFRQEMVDLGVVCQFVKYINRVGFLYKVENPISTELISTPGVVPWI